MVASADPYAPISFLLCGGDEGGAALRAVLRCVACDAGGRLWLGLAWPAGSFFKGCGSGGCHTEGCALPPLAGQGAHVCMCVWVRVHPHNTHPHPPTPHPLSSCCARCAGAGLRHRQV